MISFLCVLYSSPCHIYVCSCWQDKGGQPVLRNLPTHEVQGGGAVQPKPVEDVKPDEVQASAAPKPVEDLPASKRTQLYLKEAAAKRKATMAPVAEQKHEQKGNTSDEPAPTDEAPARPPSDNAAVEPPPAAKAGNDMPLVSEPTLPTAGPKSPVQESSHETAKPTDEPTPNQEPVDQTLALLESLGEATTQAVLGQTPELSTPADKAPEPSTLADTPGPVSQTLVVESPPRPVEESKKDSKADQLISIEDRNGYYGYGDGCNPENNSHSLKYRCMHLYIISA